MILLLCCLITFCACLLGTICGMGGGIIIKPVLDAVGVMSVATIAFLSGCTVIAMSFWSVGKAFLKKESVIDLHMTPFLGLGAAVGGLLGRQLLSRFRLCSQIRILPAAYRPACFLQRRLRRCFIP